MTNRCDTLIRCFCFSFISIRHSNIIILSVPIPRHAMMLPNRNFTHVYIDKFAVCSYSVITGRVVCTLIILLYCTMTIGVRSF